ncbi:MAG: DNA double-strand break repair nuclease NurA [Anaerolineae bacterium]|nr:DNA double-strand break repair nuclease NurA [Anaerolineae bacterium]MCX8066723.1 DNA double-strand break repair nuclease NurA [Anaerolineae bacterium]MDW7992333.1 DNA double-strand break repair nuclease NurA [Anaerolineae bacterium]
MLDLSRLTRTAREMGQALAHQERTFTERVAEGRAWLKTFAESGETLREGAEAFGAAIPTGEPLNTVVPCPPIPARFTAIGADGTAIQPDRHGQALYYLLNIGSLVYRHGSGQTPEARSIPSLHYTDDDLYEGALLVSGNLLDVRRDLAEISHLADLVEAEPSGPILALVDGTLILWVLENLPAPGRREKVTRYLTQLDRICQKGAALAAFISRPRHSEVGRLLHLAQSGGDVQRARERENPLERIPDRVLFAHLPPGSRSALFASPNSINRMFYVPAGHEILFFYLNVADEGEEPIIARVETPRWVTEDKQRLALVHAGIVAQCRITGGFPYVLARADELAYISGPEREQLEEMVGMALLAAGIVSAPSPKAYYKSLTRRGRRW